jgi:hypothetical protein
MMYSPLGDIELLLAGSRELLDIEDLDVQHLESWATERHSVFCRLKEHKAALMAAEGFTHESLLHELLEVDSKIRGRITELQMRLAKQLAATKTMRQTLSGGRSRSPQLLQRLI